ncbi:esterase/lipase family protein [Dokdonella sp.]|uniref:esterase/lipase family protein n=1 Tax=Dokdonella sp. TaxID=2291710 RepID=UPI003526D9DB
MASVQPEHVILLHGIWMRGITMLPLARRLRTAGFTVETIDYPSVVGAWTDTSSRLCRHWRGMTGHTVHVVGHSLGGMLAAQVAEEQNDLPPGRLVCLGSPLNGSAAASRLLRVPGGRWLMGQSAPVLDRGLAHWSGRRPLAIIAGSRPLGLGGLIGGLPRPHDGTVSVEETRLAGADAHCIVETSHTGLLFSAEVASLTASFLREGRFPTLGAAA